MIYYKMKFLYKVKQIQLIFIQIQGISDNSIRFDFNQSQIFILIDNNKMLSIKFSLISLTNNFDIELNNSSYLKILIQFLQKFVIVQIKFSIISKLSNFKTIHNKCYRFSLNNFFLLVIAN
ncbi:hypothetical protein pb186bvf_015895 [Paramecium bursaria]